MVGEHRVVADRHLVLGGDHRVQVEEAALADRDAALVGDRDPAARLEQGVLADRQPAVVERLEHVALDREADERLAPAACAGGCGRARQGRRLRSYQRHFWG